MAKKREREERARLIPDDPRTDLRLATLSVRPLRLAFLVNAEGPKEELLKYIAYNTSIWGGQSNFFIPVRGSAITDNWWNVLLRHDPDKVIFCGISDEQLVTEVENRIQPFREWKWSDKVTEHHDIGLDGFGSVPLRYVLRHIYEQKKPIQRSGIWVPKGADNSPLSFCVASHFGRMEKNLYDIYVEDFKAEEVEFDCNNLGGYLEGISRFRDWLSPLNMTEYGLSSSTDGMAGTLGFNIVLLEVDALAENFSVFWNLRVSRRMRPNGTVLLPFGILNEGNNLQVLGEWCNAQITWTNLITLVSASVDADGLSKLRDKLRPLLSGRFRIECWYDRFFFGRYRTYESKNRDEIRVAGRTLTLRVPKPSWGERARSGMQWVVDIDLQDPSRVGIGYIPPRFSKLNYLLAREPNFLFQEYYLRSTRELLCRCVDESTDYVSITLPEDEKLFQTLLVSKGYQPKTTDKCRYAKGMVKLLGSYEEAKILRDPRVRELLYTMQDGSAFTLDNMKQFFKLGKDLAQLEKMESLVADLALKGILLRGYQLQCPACDLRHWYGLAEMEETISCAGCLTRLQPPIGAPFCYRLNELFVRGIKQGSIPLLLAILILSNLGHESYLFVPGVKVTKEDKTVDLDILAACNGHLIVVESKDLKQGLTKDTATELIEQLPDIAAIAQDIGARVVILSTLLEEPSKELDEVIARLVQQYPDLAFRQALRADLERGYLASGEPEAPMEIQDLLPRRSTGKTGRISDPGQVFETF